MYNIVSQKYGKFPKSLDEFSKIRNDFMDTMFKFQNIIIVLKYELSNDFDVLCKLPDNNYNTYTDIIKEMFEGNIPSKTDKTAKRLE